MHIDNRITRQFSGLFAIFSVVGVFGCGDKSDSRRNSGFEEESDRPACEETEVDEDEAQQAVQSAIEALRRRGHEVDASIWHEESRFVRLAEAIAYELDCELDDRSAMRRSSRRFGGDDCAEVRVTERYEDTVGYCGPDAVQGSDCTAWRLRQPGECLNRVCHVHDLCYDDAEVPSLNIASREADVCIWSDVTATCDSDFFAGYRDCVSNGECGWSCSIVRAIASTLQELNTSVAGFSDNCVECVASGDCEVEEEGEGESESEAEAESEAEGEAESESEAESEAESEDLCAGVVCDDPPSDCHFGIGNCVDGSCVYPARNPFQNYEFETSLDGWETVGRDRDTLQDLCYWSSGLGGSAVCAAYRCVNGGMQTPITRDISAGEQIIVNYRGTILDRSERELRVWRENAGRWEFLFVGYTNDGAEREYTFDEDLPAGTRIRLEVFNRNGGGGGCYSRTSISIPSISWACP